MTILEQYEQKLLATLGSVQSNKVLHSKESSKCIRDCSKHLENLGVDLRKELIASDKNLTIDPVVNNDQ